MEEEKKTLPLGFHLTTRFSADLKMMPLGYSTVLQWFALHAHHSSMVHVLLNALFGLPSSSMSLLATFCERGQTEMRKTDVTNPQDAHLVS